MTTTDDTPDEQPQVSTKETDAPNYEWLPDKFKTPEDLVKSYSALESKLGQPTEPINFQNYTSEYNSTGNISDNSMQALADKGIPKELITDFIAGQKARSQIMEQEVKDAIGGNEPYTRMVEWANANLSTEERDAYNDAVTRSTPAAKLAVQGLYQKYRSTGQNDGNLLTGTTSTQGTSGNSFQSIAQLKRAMSDPKYKTDKVYRKEVMERLRTSDIL